VDNTEICDASGTVCYNNIYEPWSALQYITGTIREDSYEDSPALFSHDEDVGYYMLLISLTKSKIYNAIGLVGGRALVAEAKLQRELSLPLAEEQWKVEAENLFQTTLARIQISLRDYIRGAAAENPEYTDLTSPGMHDMCHAYKFHGRGWKNISVWGVVMVFVNVAMVFILSREIPGAEEVEGLVTVADRDDEERPLVQKRRKRRNILVIEWIFDFISGWGRIF
jgi:hypothetical protein